MRRKNIWTRLALVLAILAQLNPPTIFAEDAPESSAESTHDEVVVIGEQSNTATFGNKPLSETPFSVGVISEKKIEDQRAYNQRQVLKNEPSINLSLGYIGDDAYTFRGFSNQYNDAAYIRVDGLPVGNARGGSTPIENKERVEVLRGMAGLRYGFTQNVGGAVNMVLKRPTEKTSGSLSFDANSFGGMLGIFDIGGKAGDDKNFGYRVVASQEKIDSFADYNKGDRSMQSGLFEWSATPDLDLELFLEKNKRRAGYEGTIPIATDGHIFTNLPREFTPYSAESQYNYDQTTIGLGGKLALSDRWSAQYRARRTETLFDYIMLGYPYGIQPNGDLTLAEYIEPNAKNYTWTQEAVVDGEFNTGSLRHQLAFGFTTLRREYQQGESVAFNDLGTGNLFNWPPSFPSYTGTYTPALPQLATRSDELGVFLTDFVRFNPWLEVLGGARFAHLETENFYSNSFSNPETYRKGAVIPTVGVTVKPTDDVSLFAVYTEGLEQGGVAPLGTVNYQEQMAPIEVVQYETGIKVNKRKFDGSASLYYIDRPLEFINDSSVYVQDGSQVHKGVEVEGSYHVINPLVLYGAGTLIDAEQKKTGNPLLDGKEPAEIPNYNANLGATIIFPAQFELDNTVYFVGSRYIDNRERFALGGYTRWDASLRKTIPRDRIDYVVRLNVQNITDAEYFESGQFYGTSFGGWAYYGAPRSVNLSLEAKF